MDTPKERQRYVGLVCEPGPDAKGRYLCYLSGERKGQIKSWPYRGGVEIEAGRSYQKLSAQAVVVILPITPEQIAEFDAIEEARAIPVATFNA